MGRGDGVRGEEGQRPPGHESTGFHRSARPWRHRRHSGVPARGPLRSSNVAAMACGAHESARIASWRATRRRGLSRGHDNNAGRGSDRDLQKLLFLTPSFCPIARFGPRTNRISSNAAWRPLIANLVCLLVSSGATQTHRLRIRLFQALGLRRNTARAQPSTLPQRCAAELPHRQIRSVLPQ